MSDHCALCLKDLSRKSIKELKERLESMNVSIVGVTEKTELITLVLAERIARTAHSKLNKAPTRGWPFAAISNFEGWRHMLPAWPFRPRTQN